MGRTPYHLLVLLALLVLPCTVKAQGSVSLSVTNTCSETMTIRISETDSGKSDSDGNYNERTVSPGGEMTVTLCNSMCTDWWGAAYSFGYSIKATAVRCPGDIEYSASDSVTVSFLYGWSTEYYEVYCSDSCPTSTSQGAEPLRPIQTQPSSGGSSFQSSNGGGTDSSYRPGPITSSYRPKASGKSVAGVAAGAVGGLAAVGAAIAGILRCKRKRSTAAEDQSTEIAFPAAAQYTWEHQQGGLDDDQGDSEAIKMEEGDLKESDDNMDTTRDLDSCFQSHAISDLISDPAEDLQRNLPSVPASPVAPPAVEPTIPAAPEGEAPPAATSPVVAAAEAAAPVVLPSSPSALQIKDPYVTWASNLALKSKEGERRKYKGSGRLYRSLIDFNDLQIIKAIGEGSFGRVYKALYHETHVAVKILLDASGAACLDPNGDSAQELALEMFEKLSKEAGLMNTMAHPNIVEFMGACTVPPCIVIEYCERGGLNDVLQRGNKSARAAAELTWERRIKMALDAAQGMLYLHLRNPPVVHRDLKSPNLLVCADWTVKISDFNLSKIIDNTTKSSSVAAMNPRWLAPEILEDERHPDERADVYSFGVVMWELLTWQVPWGNTNPWTIVRNLRKGERPPIPPVDALPGPGGFSGLTAYIGLMQRAWHQDKNQRPDFKQIIAELNAMTPASTP